MNILETYNNWLAKQDLSPDIKKELAAIADHADEIHDRFYQNLSFGTGGLRGIIAAGSNRMNIYTVRKATQGLADYLNKRHSMPSVAIACDTRNKSEEFASCAAEVLAANKIKVFLFDSVHPTPMLSFAVRHLKASAGIVITASHNPKEYNGYKVYGADGGQITDEAAASIQKYIGACDIFQDIKTMPFTEALHNVSIQYIGEDVDRAYFDEIKKLSMRKTLLHDAASSLKIIYSPLNGSGSIPVQRILKELGFTSVSVVAEQEAPDGNFPTTPYPNPEEPSVYELAIKMAQRDNPDLIFATDPDCDRIGVLVKDDNGKYSVLTGNQTGALLCEYIIKTQKELGIIPANAAVIKTIVTTELARKICEKEGIPIYDVLTGFKYIGELAEEWTQNGTHEFIFGFEESYGFLAGNFVRDKDAVIAAALIAEMALYYKENGQTLYQALEKLMNEYGCFTEELISISLPGEAGQQHCREIIQNFRENSAKILKDQHPVQIEDYKESIRYDLIKNETSKITLPQSNVLKYFFADGSSFVLRPSGTEPKIKIYLSTTASDAKTSEKMMEHLRTFIMDTVK